jgi:protein disulfide-isomerase A1
MRTIYSFLLLALISCAVASEIELDEGVLVLTEKNFDDAIADNQYILVEFYAPWCGHCKTLAPEYAKAAKKLAAEGSKIKLAKVDATVESGLGQKYGVKGYPTLKFFSDGAAVEYKGGRDENGLVSWVKKKAQPKVRAVATVDDFEDEIRDNDVVAVFWSDKSNKNFQLFDSSSRTIDDVEFVFTNDAETKEKYQSDPEVFLTIFKRFDEGRVDFEGTFELDELKKFITNHQFPIVMEFNDKAAEKIFGQSTIPAYLMFVNHDDQETEEVLAVFREVAESNKGKAWFTSVNVHSSESNRILEFFGVKKEDTPTVRIAAQGAQGFDKFKKEFEINAQNLEDFLKEWASGKIKTYFKSQPLPEDNGEATKVAVASNFKKLVLDPTKDVLLEIYAPWCGHCQKLAPILEKAAKRLEKVPNLVIAKLDATANEIEGINVQSYPTLKWYPAFKKHSPIEAKFDHKEDDIVDWVKKHLTKKFNEDL